MTSVRATVLLFAISFVLTSSQQSALQVWCSDNRGAWLDGTCFKYTESSFNGSDRNLACNQQPNGTLAVLSTPAVLNAVSNLNLFAFSYVALKYLRKSKNNVSVTGWYWTQADGVTPCSQPANFPPNASSGYFLSDEGCPDDPAEACSVQNPQCNDCAAFGSGRYTGFLDGPCYPDSRIPNWPTLCQYGSSDHNCLTGEGTPKVCPGTGSGSEDPHFVTFDGLKYDSQTTCYYVLSQPCEPETYKGPKWSIKARNTLQPIRRASMVTFIVLFFDGHTYSAEQTAKNSPFVFKFDGVVKDLPFNDKNVRAHISDGRVNIATSTNITIQFNFGKQRVTVPVFPNYGTGILCGLLGDFDGDCSNDLIGRDGKVYAKPADLGCKIPVNGPEGMKAEAFADTWIVDRDDNCMLGTALKKGDPIPNHRN